MSQLVWAIGNGLLDQSRKHNKYNRTARFKQKRELLPSKAYEAVKKYKRQQEMFNPEFYMSSGLQSGFFAPQQTERRDGRLLARQDALSYYLHDQSPVAI